MLQLLRKAQVQSRSHVCHPIKKGKEKKKESRDGAHFPSVPTARSSSPLSGTPPATERGEKKKKGREEGKDNGILPFRACWKKKARGLPSEQSPEKKGKEKKRGKGGGSIAHPSAINSGEGPCNVRRFSHKKKGGSSRKKALALCIASTFGNGDRGLMKLCCFFFKGKREGEKRKREGKKEAEFLFPLRK